MIAFLLTPLGRYIAMGVIVIMALYGIYWKIGSDAVTAYQAKETAQSLEKVDEAVKAGDRIDVIDADPNKLRSPDAVERK